MSESNKGGRFSTAPPASTVDRVAKVRRLAEDGYAISGVLDPLESYYHYSAFEKKFTQTQTKGKEEMGRWTDKVAELNAAFEDADREFDTEMNMALEDTRGVKKDIKDAFQARRVALDDMRMTLRDMRSSTDELKRSNEQLTKSGQPQPPQTAESQPKQPGPLARLVGNGGRT